jgi:hypothetical protein
LPSVRNGPLLGITAARRNSAAFCLPAELLVFSRAPPSGLDLVPSNADKIRVNQKLDQKLVVSYEGKDYEVKYSVSDDGIAVEIVMAGAFVRKTTAQIGGGRSFSIARMMALEILRNAKQRGELG